MAMQPQESRKQWIATMMLFASAFFWGMGYIWNKQVTDIGMGTSAFVSVRYIISIAILLPFFWKDLRRATRKQLLLAGSLGLILYAGMGAQMIGLQYTTAGNGAFVTSAYVVLVPFINWLLNHKKPGVRSLLAVALCVAGLYALNCTAEGFEMNIGNAIMLIPALSWAIQVPMISYVGERASIGVVSVMPMVVAGALSTVVALVNGEFVMPAAQIRALAKPMLLTVIFSSALTNTAQVYGQKQVPATRAAIIYTCESVFACIMSVVLGMEPMTPQLLIGGGLIMLGVLLSELPLNKLPLGRRKEV